MNAFRSLLFLLFAAGLGASYIVMVLLPKGMQVTTGLLAYIAFPFWLLGGVMILRCFWDFTFKGRGTPDPIDAPKELVTTGLYREGAVRHVVREVLQIGPGLDSQNQSTVRLVTSPP